VTVQKQIREPDVPSLDLPVFGYYGTGRLCAQKKLTESGKGVDDTLSADFYIRTFAYLNCLDPASTYKHFKEWFTWASFVHIEQLMSHLAGKSTEEAVHRAEAPVLAVRNAIDCFLRPITGWHSLEYSHSHEKSLVLRHPQLGTMKVGMLSDGIRSVLSMIGDMAYRCIRLNPHLGGEAPQNTQGVVLIDEIDMHLHPHWQQVVIGQLREAFPKIQFIVTTHSPQVLTTVSRENIRILQPTESGFEASKPDFSPLAHESGDALSKIMGTHREPELPLQDDIRRYEQLVRTGHESSTDAQQLRNTLECAGYQFHDSDLATWRFLAARKSGRAG
jgi:predicted ATP-binding protein involved in virulence